MTLSTDAQTMMFAEETGDGLLVLLTINHADLAQPIRVVHNMANITSRGDEFIAFPFELSLGGSSPDQPPKAQLTIDNVSREIGEAVRTISSAPTVLIEIVRIDDVDTVELSYPAFDLRNVRFDQAKVTGDLVLENLKLEPYPVYAFTPGYTPGLF